MYKIRKIFIILTADDCGPCIEFKTTHLKSVLQKTKFLQDLTTIHINLKKRSESISDRYHPQFRASRKWFPGFYIFYEKDFYDFKRDLSGEIIGGTFIKGTQLQRNDDSYTYVADKIYEWVKTQTQTRTSRKLSPVTSTKTMNPIKFSRIQSNDDVDYMNYNEVNMFDIL